jgi:MFS family permease
MASSSHEKFPDEVESPETASAREDSVSDNIDPYLPADAHHGITVNVHGRADAPPNGGYGWVCTACCALINAHTWGMNSSYGVFLAHYLANNTFPGASPLEYAFVGSLSISCAMLISPLATLSTRIIGTRKTLAMGVVLHASSLIGASFCDKIWQLSLSQGVGFGLGMGFLYIASNGIPLQWFDTRRSLASGIAAAGSGVGGLVYSLASGAMIRSIGLPWVSRNLMNVIDAHRLTISCRHSVF